MDSGGWRGGSQNVTALPPSTECMSSELLEELMSSEGGWPRKVRGGWLRRVGAGCGQRVG